MSTLNSAAVIQESLHLVKSPINWVYGATVLLTWIIFYRLFLHPLAGVPGPFVARFTGLWRTTRYFKGTWYDDILGLHRKYGRVVRIAPNEVSFVDGEALKRLYGHGKPCKKTNWYSTWDQPKAGPGFFAEQDPHLHAFLRKRVAQAYTMTSVIAMEKYIQNVLDLLLQRMHQHSGKIINFTKYTSMFAFDVVGELAYGEQIGLLANDEDKMGLMRLIFNGFYLMSNMGNFWGQMKWFNSAITQSIMGLFLKPEDSNPFKPFQEWTTQRIKDRQNHPSERKDMLNHFMDMKTAEGEPVGFGEVSIEAQNIIGAGADTTAIALRATFDFLIRHPKHMKRLQAEIDKYHDTNNLSAPITYAQCLELPFLQAVIKEAGRLHPSIMYQLPRYAPPEGITIDDHFLPAGTEIGMSPLSMNRDTAIFGIDADEFRPERWMENPEKARYMDSLLTTFGYGSRTCIGRNIALFEWNKFLVQFLREFDIKYANPDKPYHLFSAWFATQENMMVIVTPRRK